MTLRDELIVQAHRKARAAKLSADEYEAALIRADEEATLAERAPGQSNQEREQCR